MLHRIFILFIIFIKTFHSKVIISDSIIPFASNGFHYYQEGRIVNGFLAKRGQFPHQVCLLNRREATYTLCGGSIISNEFILTAAHCVMGVLSTTVSFGAVDRNFPTSILTATKNIIHAKYDSKTLNNDIALWRLPTKISFNDQIKPISLPKQSQASNSFENYNAIVSGYGRTETSSTSSRHLRYAPVKIVGNPLCASIYGSHVIISGTICTLGHDFVEQGPCNGDSGSPLTLKENNTDVLLGVASFVSSRGCGTNRPSGFVRTSEYLEWLRINAGINVVS